MPDPTLFRLFVLAAFILAVTPGPAVLYIVTRSVGQGRGAGFVSCLGVGLGGLVHVAAATLGLSAVLASSALAFGIVKYAGAIYLVFLGIRKLRSASAPGDAVAGPRPPLRRVFLDGVVVNVLNPKTALFFLAFLPQFVDPKRGPLTPQLLVLGATFVLIAFTTDSLWSLFSGSAGLG